MLSLAFDTLFATMGGFIPVPFLRTLAYHESSLNPNAVTKSSNATGLFQVTKTVLNDYNLLHGTKYTLADTKDPALNTKIGIELLTRIVRNYQKNHPNTLAMDFKSPRYVELLVQGFNAGYSEVAGVGYVVGRMEAAGLAPEKINVDTVAEAAKKLGASKYLYIPERVSYAKAVTKTYFKEIAEEEKKRKEAVAKEESKEFPSDAIRFTIEPKGKVAATGKENPRDRSVSTAILIAFPFIPMVGYLLSKTRKKRKVKYA